MPRLSSCARKLAALAAIEGAVAAARASTRHRLELGERAHARAADAGVVESSHATRIGNGARCRRGDQHVIALAHSFEQAANVGIGEAHAAMRHGPAEQPLVIGAVEIDVALERVMARPAVHAVLESVEGENAGEDEIVVARFPGPGLAGRLARSEHTAPLGVFADAAMHAMPSRRRAIRILRAADPRSRRRHRPCATCLPAFEQNRALALDIDHQEARGKL